MQDIYAKHGTSLLNRVDKGKMPAVPYAGSSSRQNVAGSAKNSWCDVVRYGRPLKDECLNLVTSESQEAACESLFVATLAEGVDEEVARSCLNSNGFLSIRVIPLDCDHVGLRENQGNNLSDLLKPSEKWWKLTFKSIQRWNSKYDYSGRKAWVRCTGVPANAWDVSSFQKIASTVGRFIKVSRDTECINRLDYDLVLVATLSPLSINHHCSVLVNREVFLVGISEVVGWTDSGNVGEVDFGSWKSRYDRWGSEEGDFVPDSILESNRKSAVHDLEALPSDLAAADGVRDTGLVLYDQAQPEKVCGAVSSGKDLVDGGAFTTGGNSGRFSANINDGENVNDFEEHNSPKRFDRR